MDQTLKEKILKLFQDNEDICIDYSLFLNSKADTEFVGCTGKEKKKYWDIFQHMEQKDPGTKIVIHIYDEEDGRWFADDAYLETSLSEEDLKGIFEEFNKQYEEYLSPSQLHCVKEEERDYYMKGYYVGDNGENQRLSEYLKGECLVFYCWWD